MDNHGSLILKGKMISFVLLLIYLPCGFRFRSHSFLPKFMASVVIALIAIVLVVGTSTLRSRAVSFAGALPIHVHTGLLSSLATNFLRRLVSRSVHWRGRACAYDLL